LQLSVLQKGVEIANSAGEFLEAEEFRKEYNLRKPPPPEPKKK